MTQAYKQYSKHLVEKYGEKVYKLPINLPGTCPNRDGNISIEGCYFCDEDGSGFECLPNTMSIKNQIKKNKEFFIKRFKAKKFIAYFQAFTNTYMELEDFKRNIKAAAEEPDIVGISISTRPDCISREYLDYLEEIKNEHNLEIDIELGLQTVNYHTLIRVNRGHTLAEFIDAVLNIKMKGFNIVAHIILNLPGDDMDDVKENAKILSALGIDYVKLHSLYIVKNTKLGEMYLNKEFELISLEEYIDRVVTFIEYIDPNMVIQRIVGKGPIGNLEFCNWSTSWWKIKEMIDERLEAEKTYQGRKFDYLNGSALKKFKGV